MYSSFLLNSQIFLPSFSIGFRCYLFKKLIINVFDSIDLNFDLREKSSHQSKNDMAAEERAIPNQVMTYSK